jgi:hypothetical protein
MTAILEKTRPNPLKQGAKTGYMLATTALDIQCSSKLQCVLLSRMSQVQVLPGVLPTIRPAASG